MSSSKIYWATNLKRLRKRRDLSQEALATKLGMSRSKYNAHESGQTVNPIVEDLILISDFFKMSIDCLLKTDLTKVSDYKIHQLMLGNDQYMDGSQLRILAISVDKNDKENMEYVPIKAKAGYSAGFSDPEYIAALPKFSLPNLPKDGTFRMFPTVGDSMLPIPEGADIVCRFVQNWMELKPKTLCIVILKNEHDFVFKQVTLNEDHLLLESLNKSYNPYTAPLSDVLEIWQLYSYQTKEIPEANDLQSLSMAIKEIQQDLKIIKDKK